MKRYDPTAQSSRGIFAFFLGLFFTRQNVFIYFFHNYETNFSTLLLIKNAIYSPLLRISVSGLLREKNLKNCSKIFFVSCMYVLRLLSDCRNVLKCQNVVDLDTNVRWAACRT